MNDGVRANLFNNQDSGIWREWTKPEFLESEEGE